eukprot:GHVU01007139.1.p2 GENE.GHVU01007139.1~~GHVU01007139.1.p2  ORF type:complete len:168 (-),score=2.43 GHVU01007139.1:761-1264(-)
MAAPAAPICTSPSPLTGFKQIGHSTPTSVHRTQPCIGMHRDSCVVNSPSKRLLRVPFTAPAASVVQVTALLHLLPHGTRRIGVHRFHRRTFPGAHRDSSPNSPTVKAHLTNDSIGHCSTCLQGGSTYKSNYSIGVVRRCHWSTRRGGQRLRRAAGNAVTSCSAAGLR